MTQRRQAHRPDDPWTAEEIVLVAGYVAIAVVAISLVLVTFALLLSWALL